MVVIAAGLASMPRDVLEAARTDGATELQVFRRVTVPLLAPVLSVVFVTMIINVLKVFDIVIALAPESTQPNATVIALAMWRTAFSGVRLRHRLSDRSLPLPPRDPGARAQHPALQERRLVVARAEPIVIPRPGTASRRRSCACSPRRRSRSCSRRSALLWLVPTIGLFVTSIVPQSAISTEGWWKIFSHPSLATWSNYGASSTTPS